MAAAMLAAGGIAGHSGHVLAIDRGDRPPSPEETPPEPKAEPEVKVVTREPFTRKKFGGPESREAARRRRQAERAAAKRGEAS